MKKFLCFFFLLIATRSFSQIYLHPIVTGQLGVDNPSAKSVLINRMTNSISRAGLISTDVDGRFVLAAKVNVLQKEITPTAPQQYVLHLMLTFTVGDGYTGTSFLSTSFEVKGVGPSEERAFLSALKTMNANAPQLISICQNAHDRILDYYNTNGARILSSSKSLIASHKYDEACAMLYGIPFESSYYEEACRLMEKAIKGYAAYNSEQIVAEAEAMWAGNPSADNAPAVMELLYNVPTDTPAYSRAQALRAKIEKRLLFLQAQEHSDNQKLQKELFSLERQRVAEDGKTRRAVAKAAGQVAAAYYNSQRVVYHIHTW